MNVFRADPFDAEQDSGLEIGRVDGGSGLRLAGELDMRTAPELAKALRAMDGAGPVRLDMEGMTFIDSSGLHVIEGFLQTRDGNGAGLIIEGLAPEMVWLFEFFGLAAPRVEIRVNGNG